MIMTNPFNSNTPVMALYFLLQPNIKRKVSCKLKCVLKENCIKRMLILYFTKIDKNASYYHIVELVCKQ